jgi:lipoprotein NlpI
MEMAITEGDTALSINLNSAELHANLALAYIAGNYYSEAIDEVILAVSLNPRYQWAHSLKGHAHYFLEGLDRALEAYDVALSIEPNNPYYILSKYLTLIRYERSDEAKKFLAEAEEKLAEEKVKKSSSTATWSYNLVRYCAGKLSEGRLLARATGPWEKGGAYFYIGSLKLLQGDTEAAKQNFLQCIKTNTSCSSEYVRASIELKILESSK